MRFYASNSLLPILESARYKNMVDHVRIIEQLVKSVSISQRSVAIKFGLGLLVDSSFHVKDQITGFETIPPLYMTGFVRLKSRPSNT